MTDKAILRDKTTAHVRALLMSSKLPLTVHELKRDYFNFIGEQLRYRDMGFATLEDFLRDIEDAVHIGWKNGLMTLSAKADEATKHIQSLVSRQKLDPKKKYAVLQKRPRTQRHFSASYRTHGPPQPAPLVSAYVIGQIKQLLRCHTDGLPLTHFNSVFSRKYGASLNFKRFGFDSLYELLSSLRDVVRIQELQEGERWVTAADIPGRSAALQPPTRSQVVDETRAQGQQTRSRLSDESTGQKRPSKGRGRRRENSGDINTKSVGSTESHDSSENLEQYQDSETRMKMQIRKILQKYPDGLWARQLPAEYAQQFGKHLDFREQGYVSVIDFVAAFPDIVRLDRPNHKSDWMLFDACLPVPQVREPGVSQRDRSHSGITLEETKNSIQKVLEMMPDGIPVSTFPHVFQELSGSHLPVKELGFDTPEDLFLSLADSVLQLVFRSSSGFLVYPANADIDDEKMEDVVEEVPLPAEVPNCPTGAVGPGVHYTPVLPPEPEGYVEVFVSNISSPGLFWVQLRRKDTTLELENLMDTLDYFYNSDSSRDYVIPDSLIVPGQVCAAIFPEDQNWHRGVITGTNNEGFVQIEYVLTPDNLLASLCKPCEVVMPVSYTLDRMFNLHLTIIKGPTSCENVSSGIFSQVYYVDYGNTNFVDKSSIRFLKLEYLKLPAQALQSRLASIAPKDKVWKPTAKARMLKLCINKPLIAYITAVVDQVLSVCLTDTNSSEDIHINDLLVHDGYALFYPDTDESLHAAQFNLQEVPDYGHVYGWTTNREAPRLPTVAKDERKEENAASRGYVKWVQLTKDHVIHMINLEGVAYIVSAEISSLIWDEDILSSMLKKKHIDASKVIITSEDHPKLFEDLRKFKVKSLTSELHGRKQFVSLYTLDCVPTILRVFEHPSTELIRAVEELIARFDSKSPYWKGSTTDSTEASSVSAPSISESSDETEHEDTVASREGKHIALQALQFKRKRILQNLMSDPSRTVEFVNDLNNCEIEIRIIKDEIETQSQIDSKNSSFTMETEKTTIPKVSTDIRKTVTRPTVNVDSYVQGAATSGPTGLKTPEKQETDKETYVKNILASATKPSAAAHIVTKPSVTVETSPIRSLPQFTNLGNQSAYRLPQMTVTSQVTGSNPLQLNPLLMQQRMQNMSQFSFGAGNQLVGNAGTMGLNPFLMQQRMMAPAMMAQQGIMPPHMNIQQFPGQCPGLLPAVNPLMYQTITNSGDASMQTMPQLQMAGVGGVARGQPSMGRGQMLRPESMGLLPGLYPLLQNLSMGRGNLGPQGKKN